MQVQQFLTSGDRSVKLQRSVFEAEPIGAKANGAAHAADAAATIVIDEQNVRQTVQGFGYTLTQGSAELLTAMSPAARHGLLEEMYGDGAGALHLSELRLPIGSTDMSSRLYTLDDIPLWRTDPELQHFSLDADRATMLPIIHEILAIRPGIHITAAPWTAPLWMKEPLSGDRYGALFRNEFKRNVFQCLWPMAAVVFVLLLVVAVLRGRLRAGHAVVAMVVAALAFLAVTRTYEPLKGAYPLFRPMVPGGGHIAGLTESTLEDAAMWPRGRWYPGYLPTYARLYLQDYEDACVITFFGVRSMLMDGRDWTGGQLRREQYGTYAKYLARYVQAMRAEGVSVESITVQNESEPNLNRPSMGWNAEQENTFVRDYLGPELQGSGTGVKLIAFDHNAEHTGFPLRMLKDARTNAYLDGASFHLYLGDIANLSRVHAQFPEKHLYFTEQMVIEDTRRGVRWPSPEPVERIFVGALRNWSESVMLWNLASDAEAGPHAFAGGCPSCLGAVTLTGDGVTRNLGYDAMAQVARFVPEGSRVLTSTDTSPTVGNVAVRTPDGDLVLVVTNLGPPCDFRVVGGGVRFQGRLDHNSMATYVWRAREAA